MSFKKLTDIDVRGKRVLIRADLNAPLDAAGEVASDARLRAALPGIRYCLDGGAALMVSSHLGRPREGAGGPGDSLAPVARALARLLGRPVPLVTDWLDGGFAVTPGNLVLLENTRLNPGEKASDETLSRRIARLCDIWVHDAFGTAHRAEASTHGVGRFAATVCAGPCLAAEVSALSRVLAAPQRPIVAIVGGAKVSTKIGVLESLAARVDHLIVGGGIANTFLLARGAPVGRSLAEPDCVAVAKAIMARTDVPLPEDVRVAKAFSPEAAATTRALSDVADDDLILDVGPESALRYARLIAGAGTVLWNGPLGVFEFPAFADGTATLARAIARSPAFSLAGGGDTLAAIERFGVGDDIGYISTGGGAFLEYLEGRRLPAIDILEQRAA